jgi:chemotaxis protein methyltransferase CheR
MADYGAYRAYVEAGEDSHELVQMIDCICTNETSFFREPHQFEFIESVARTRLAPAIARGEHPPCIKAWSVACSSGEEPYSLAMTLLDAFPSESGVRVDVLATDLSTKVLAKAVQGYFPIARADQVPRHHLTRFMLRGTGQHEGTMAVGPELRSVVRFRRMNLIEDAYPNERDFDFVLCRNVLIYFDQPTRAQVLGRLIGHLAEKGYLLLGHAESIHQSSLPVYRHGLSTYALFRPDRAPVTTRPPHS